MPTQDISIEAEGSCYTGNINVLGENSTVMLNSYSADEGQTVTFEAFVKEGYALSSVVVETENGEIELTRDGEKYTFEMPAEDVTVRVQATELPDAVDTASCNASAGVGNIFAIALLAVSAMLKKRKI